VEVEQAICEHRAANLAAVVAVPHPTFQEVGHAFVELAPDAETTPEAIIAFLRERIANYKIPKTITLEQDLPKLPNGKIDKLALRVRAGVSA
jgi:acyl-CoA synthetase (AMP-forming)/AMP-acid ligase II